MLMYCVHMGILLIAFMDMKVNGQGCPRGRFGAGCRLECHCERSQDCGVGGQCPNNESCRSPYFATGCQHVDLIITHGSGDIPEYIRDYNDATCNPDTTATSVQLKFNNSVWLVWYRIRTNYNLTLFHRNFTTKAGGDPCQRVYLYRVDDTALDVRCDTNVAITNLTIEGPVVPYICTINVSGGRNVALYQSVRQTSNYAGDPLSKVRAENAVDGNISPNYASGTCSRTEAEVTLPNWILVFDLPKWINRIVIYNTNVNQNWLCKFEMATFDSRGKAGWYHRDSSPQALSVYAILLNAGQTVKGLKIQATRATQPQVTLSLCEVQVFGEAACSSDQHGLDCENRCRCTTGVNCSSITGACEYTPVYYCPPGTYGELCEFPCAENCYYNVCTAQSGVCVHCIPGYMGEFCDQVCTPGTFGTNCSLNCSENCADPCHHITGVCSCIEGHTGQLCSVCTPYTFGTNCSLECSEKCAGPCHHITGVCSCMEGHTGQLCSVCTPYTFGTNCSLNCSEKCAEPCHHITGDCSCVAGHTGQLCSECAAGWYGDNCTHKCSDLCYMKMCDFVTGECETCIDKHTGYFCEECDIGWFGDNCTQKCPKICPSQMCDNITGECLTCIGNRTGPKCQDCPAGYYGAMCDIRCSAFCRNRSCDEVGGTCHACVDGYLGEYCNLEMEDTFPSFWILPLIVPFFVMLLVCFLVGGGHTQEEDE